MLPGVNQRLLRAAPVIAAARMVRNRKNYVTTICGITHLVSGKSALRFFLEVEVLCLFSGDADAKDPAALELTGRCIQTADWVTALVPDALPPAQSKLAGLGPHRPFRNHLVVDIELGRAKGLVVLPRFLPDELHAQRVLAGLECGRDKLLLWLDAEEIVDVVELLVLDEQRVTAEARTHLENDTSRSSDR